MRKIFALIPALLILLTSFAGCTFDKSKKDNGKINVVTTIFPQYDFARAIAGDKINLDMLLKPGAESHSYDPTPSDIIKIQQADVFIYIGGHNEAWVDKILSTIDTSKIKIVKLIDSVELKEDRIVEGMDHDHDHAEDEISEEDHDHDHAEIELDEHIWTSPINAITMIEVINDALIEVDEDNSKIYKTNALDYKEKILTLDSEFKEIVDSAQYKTMIFGDRFPLIYFADEYGLDYRAAFPGCSSETEVSVKTLTYLIDLVKEKNVKYVFYIEFSNKSIAEVISDQTGAELLMFHTCHNVTQTELDNGVTYYDLMKQNTENLKKGLNV